MYQFSRHFDIKKNDLISKKFDNLNFFFLKL